MKIPFLKITILGLLSAGLLSILAPHSASAYLAGFNPERIMDDTVMGDKDTLSESQIQTFLKSKNSCNDTNFSKITGRNETTGWYIWTDSKGIQRTAYYNIRDGHFVCMADESFDGESAAHIIWQAAQDYSINPQVLIVLLQKEQGLVTDTFPNTNYQYAAATGYDCPDNGGGCNNANSGFKTQVRKAASLFRTVLDGGWTNYPVGENYVQYNPNASCGGSNLIIKNRATSALYRYTPYQPNSDALAAGWGTVNCGAYGNRNFYNYFTDWFGLAYHNDFQLLDTPRWMQIKTTGTQKVDVMTAQDFGEVFTAGRQMRFIDKILINDKWYLRTEFNYNDGGLYAIPQDDLEEIPYQSITPKWVTFTTDGNRSMPASRVSIGDILVRGTSVKVVDQISIDSNIYYRTEFNKNNNQSIGIHSRFITDFAPIPLATPRDFCSNTSINQVDPQAGTVLEATGPGSHSISKKTLINGTWYFQALSDENTTKFFSSNDIHDVCYVSFEGPRSMRIIYDVVRFNPYTGVKLDTLTKNTLVAFSTKIFLNNQWYFRTTHNTSNNIDAVIPASSVTD